ncbi:AMP-binding protein [Candidatus Pacearchaeota archaeon]|nr:AMP-binding protein [Candidatus Pacearchaeota archaeon]
MFDIWKKAEKSVVLHGSKMNVIESCIERHASEYPDKIAFVFENESGRIKKYTYAELKTEVNRFANLLKKLEIKKGERIFIFLPKCPELYISFLASVKHGSIAAPLFEAFQTQGLELRLNRGNANVLITNKQLLTRLENRRKFKNMKIIVVDSSEHKRQIKKCENEFDSVLVDKKDTAVMIFTSSTAGTPVAGIELPHQGLIQQHYTADLVLDLKPEDKYWCTAHPGWVTGSVYGILAPLSIGCTNYVYESHFKADKWLDFLRKHKISVVYTAPTVLRMFKYDIRKRDLKYVRNLCSVGEALTKTTFNYIKKLGVSINDTYWQTETGAMVIANWPGLKKKSGSMGKAIPGIKISIIDKTIHLKPAWPAMMTGIYKHDKMYKGYFKNGWFKTNDMAKLDKQGYFFFIGRKDDIIKTAGERVSPIEIENVLIKHKNVKEAAVIGIPDKLKGSIIKAFIVLNKNIKADDNLKEELKTFVKKNYAGHSYPKEIQFIDKLPKTNSGKIIRAKLREEEK